MAMPVAAALALALALALAVPGAEASEPTTSTSTTASETTTPTSAPTETTTTGTGSTSTPAPAPSTAPAPAPTAPPSGSETAPEAPQVEHQHVQHATPGAHRGRSHGRKGKAGKGKGAGGVQAGGGVRAKHRAPSPSTFTPSLPLGLGSVSGVPNFFVESFQIPPFLLPIYQAAGTAYGIPWQVLAAINEVETDYGRDLSVSSAGAEGWMQFLPSSWAQYGVDANGDGYRDPYNPADAIFAAARYLKAAGGSTNIKAAIYSYNHSQAYVSSVMLRAQLLGGTPPELLGAVTGLTEARFPVHAPSHFSDGFPTVGTGRPGQSRTLAATTIYSLAGAPVIAVQDGRIVGLGDSPTLGRYVSLRDAYGNVYTYGQLGTVAGVYPVLEPRDHTNVSTRIVSPGHVAEPPPSGPATAGAQPRSPLSPGAIVSGLALGAAASLESAPAPALVTPKPALVNPHPLRRTTGNVKVFRSGQNDVFLHPLRVGVQVIAGTVLGHLGSQGATVNPTASTSAGGQGAQMLFQIRPAGAGAPSIDPKPILDGWVALENTSTFRAKGENPFLATSPTAGQVLLASKGQLEQQVARDTSIRMRRCERAQVQTGRVDRRLLAAVELLSVSGLKPTVTGLTCAVGSPASAGNAPAALNYAFKITAINGVPIAGHQGSGSITDTTVRKLLTLEGANRPQRIVSSTAYPGAKVAVTSPKARDYIAISFGPPGAAGARAAGAQSSALSPAEWTRLIARLGEIPDPNVSGGPSSAAIADGHAAAGVRGKEGETGGRH